MKRKFRTAKRWMGLLLSVLLVVEASSIQALAAERAGSMQQTVAENVEETVSQGEIGGTEDGTDDVTAGDVTSGDIVNSGSAEIDNTITADVVASGTYYGMDWSVDANGLLLISGTYSGVWGANDVKWSTKNADNIMTAKVTATGVTSTKEWFRSLMNLHSVDFSEFDASKVTKMYWMFIGCASLQEVDLSKFADADVTDLSYMFQDCTYLKYVNFGNLDTSKVTDMSFMFQDCRSLETLDLSSFDTSSVKNMCRMFDGCEKLSSLDISSFNTQNVTTMDRMFGCCEALKELDLSHFNTTNVTDMDGMFYDCYRLEKLNLSGFDMSKVTSASDMLYRCVNLSELWTPKNITLDIETYMPLVSENGDIHETLPKNVNQSFYMECVKDNGNMYGIKWYLSQRYKLKLTGTYGTDSEYSDWSKYRYTYTIKNVEGNPTRMTDMDCWFQEFMGLYTANLENFDTSAVESVQYMFDGCESLQEVNFKNWTNENVTDMSYMFRNCTSLESLDFSGFQTDKLQNTTDMLEGCSGLMEVYCFKNLTDKTVVELPAPMLDKYGNSYTEMPIGRTDSLLLMKPVYQGTYCGMNWMISNSGHLSIYGSFTTAESTDAPWLVYADMIKTAAVSATGVTSTKKWFYNMPNLTAVDLTAFDSSKVVNMSYMFYGCSALATLDLSQFNTAKVTSMAGIFGGCSSLTKLDLSSFNTSAVTDMSNMFDECKAMKEIVWNKSTFNTAKVTNMRYMFRHCMALETLDVGGFDTALVTSMLGMFYNCKALTTLDVSGFNTSNVTDMNCMFYYCKKATALDVSGFDTANVTDMSYMFGECNKVSALDMSQFDMSKVTVATDMFKNCTALLRINAPKNLNLDVALPAAMIDNDRVEYTALPKNKAVSVALRVPGILAKDTYYGMDWTLMETGYLTISGTYDKNAEEGTCWTKNYADKISSAKITARNVPEMDRWFYMCTNLKTVDFSEFDSSALWATCNMFWGCTSLTEIDLSNVNMSKITVMDRMFIDCSALKTVNFGEVDNVGVLYIEKCFSGCSALTSVDLSGFDLTKVKEPTDLFAGCESLVEIKAPKNLKYDVTFPVALNDSETGLLRNDLPKNRTESVLLKKAEIVVSGIYTGMNWTINEFGGLEIFGAYGKTADTDTIWKDYKDLVKSVRVTATGVTNTYHWFNNMTNLERVDFSAFDTSKVTTMNETFYGCTALTEVNLSNVNTSNVTNMYRMFYNCSELAAVDVSGFDTSKVTTMAGMFGQCGKLTALDVSNFNTENVTDMSHMFFRCYAVEELDVSKFNTAKVTTMRQMFYECLAVKALDVSGFKTANVTDMYAMFYKCSNPTVLDVSGFDTSKVTNMNRMFWCCGKVTALDMSKFNMAAVTDADVMLYGCASLKQIKTPVNLALDVDLPAVYGIGSGVIYKTLPKNMTESVTLHKAIGSGVWCQMKWIVEHDGMLYITGAYGKTADTDTIWKDYASQVVGVKIMATGATNTYHWFNNMTKMETADLSEFDSSKVTTMNEMFYNCKSLKELDASNLDTSKVTNTYRMFYNCSALTRLDLGGCDFGAVTDATEMLYGCNELGYINAPKNLTLDVALPGELEDKERNIYNQLPKDLEESIVLTHVIYRIAPIEDQVYTGKAIKPAVVVYKGKRILTEGVDYTVSYKNNVNAADKDAKKAPTVTVKGKTNYMGTLKATFTIQAKEITTKNVVTTPTIVAKNGKVQSFKSTVTVDGKKLKLKKDYVIVATDTSEGAYEEPGRYAVVIQGINNYKGTVISTLIILDKEQVQASKLKISKLPTYTYVEGEPARPVPVVTYGGKVLVKDVDYSIIYTDNYKAGKASLKIRGLENVAEDGVYVVGTVTKTFTIKGTAINKVKVNYTNTANYTGQEICPEVVLTMDETTLREGIDYSVSYSKNIKVGTGTITIKGEGGYTGTMKKTFKIVADSSVAERVTVAFIGGEATAYYSAMGAKPEVVVKLDGTVLEPGKDYTVSYKNNKKIPAADVTEKKAPAVVIKGKGNYKFTKTVYFTIVACPIEKLNVIAADKFLGDKKGYLSAPVVKDGTKKLKKGKDYEIVGYKAADGTAFNGKEEVANDTYVTVTVRGLGNYTGEESVTYRIATKSMSKVKITAKPLAYNEGKPVIYIGQDIKDGLLVLKDNQTKETLQYGRDYKIIGYTNNTKTGTATVTIVGCGEYGGTRNVKFKIVKYKLK